MVAEPLLDILKALEAVWFAVIALPAKSGMKKSEGYVDNSKK